MQPQTHIMPLNDANRLGLNYRHEAAMLPYSSPIIDAHIHIWGLKAARDYLRIADWFGVTQAWSQTPLKEVSAIKAEFGDRIHFVAVPDYSQKDDPETFTTKWFSDIDKFAELGAKMIKFWSAPRGRDIHPSLRLDSPERLHAMKIAYSAGMMFMVHIADPDTWFATHYKDAGKYGTKDSQYLALERLLDQYGDVKWLAAHMCGLPENLDRLQQLLDRHPNLYIDTSATKWMVRELSKQGDRLTDFVHHNVDRILWGTDIVASDGHYKNGGDDHYASRFWAMRTLFETDYDGPSPIVDPDLSLIDPTLPRESTVRLRGIKLDPATLQALYHDTTLKVLK